jgi:hypothetical protein
MEMPENGRGYDLLPPIVGQNPCDPVLPDQSAMVSSKIIEIITVAVRWIGVE